MEKALKWGFCVATALVLVMGGCTMPVDDDEEQPDTPVDPPPVFVAVTGITGEFPARIVKNTELNLNTPVAVQPDTATHKTIVWSIQDPESFGVTAEEVGDGIFTPTQPGTLQITATIANGTAEGQAFVKSGYQIAVVEVHEILPVSAITGDLPAETLTGTELDLNSFVTVEPENATNRVIVWSIENPESFGLTAEQVKSGKFTPSEPGDGTMEITATILSGKGTEDFVKSGYTISIARPFVPVTGISATETWPARIGTGEELNLNSAVTVEPADATNRAIVWSINDPESFGVTAEEVGDGIFTPTKTGDGTMEITATIAGGKGSSDFIKIDFEGIAVEEELQSIKVSSTDDSIMEKGGTRQFSLEFEGIGTFSRAVTWELEGSSEGSGTSLSETGLLTIGHNETHISLTVRALAADDLGVSGEATVKVKGWRTINLYDLVGAATVIYGIAYGNDTWVAVVSKGRILYSRDGESWQKAASPVTEDLGKVIYDGPVGSKKFIAIGDKDTIVYSIDGETWNTAPVSEGATRTINGIAYGNNQFIATDSKWDQKTVGVLTSTDGTSWTRTSHDFSEWTDDIEKPRLAFGNGRFVMTLGTYGILVTSTDGETWTLAASGKDGSVTGYPEGTTIVWTDCLKDIIYAEHQFIAVGDSGQIVLSENEALTSWTLGHFGSAIGLEHTAKSTHPTFIRFAGGKYITDAPTSILHDELVKLMYTSSLLGDGTTGWTLLEETAAFGTLGPRDAAYGDGKFIAVGAWYTDFKGLVIAYEETLE